MASDSRSNAGFDQVNVCRKMYRFVQEGERVFVILTSGSLSISQSIMSLLRLDFDAGQGLAQARSMYQASRIVGECVRRVSEIDRASLERDSFTLQREPAAGRPGPRRGAGTLPDLPAGQSRCRRPRTHRTCSSASASTAGRFSIAASTWPRRSRWRPSTRCCRSTPRCDRTSPSGRRSTCSSTRRTPSASTRYRRLSAMRSGSEPDSRLVGAVAAQRAVEQLPEIHFDEPDRAQHAAGDMARAAGGTATRVDQPGHPWLVDPWPVVTTDPFTGYSVEGAFDEMLDARAAAAPIVPASAQGAPQAHARGAVAQQAAGGPLVLQPRHHVHRLRPPGRDRAHLSARPPAADRLRRGLGHHRAGSDAARHRTQPVPPRPLSRAPHPARTASSRRK